jgi:hypothetical protein
MVRRWDLAMVEKEACASLCAWGGKTYARLDCSPLFLAAPLRPYMGGEVSGSGPNRLHVYTNLN